MNQKHALINGNGDDFCGVAVDDMMEGFVKFSDTKLSPNSVTISTGVELQNIGPGGPVDLLSQTVEIVLNGNDLDFYSPE